MTGNKATITTAALSVAGSPHTITAEYSSDGNVGGSSGTLSGGQTVVKRRSTTAVTRPNPSSVYGQSVTFTATVTAGQGTFDTAARCSSRWTGATTVGR